MYLDKDEFVISDENENVVMTLLSTIGNRADQQDSAAYLIDNTSLLVTICDGMGGHEGGKKASRLAVSRLTEKPVTDADAEVNGDLLDRVTRIDQEIAGMCDESGNPLKGGTTVVAVSIRDNRLHWVSVGDSRMYLQRGEDLVQVTYDHVYAVALEENREVGLIDEHFYESESENKEALISFLGRNGLPLIDSNNSPFLLKSGDKILLMSDGLYKYVEKSEMNSVISNFAKPTEALKALNMKAERWAQKNQIRRDNMTVALISIK